jgi:hypothetical protein
MKARRRWVRLSLLRKKYRKRSTLWSLTWLLKNHTWSHHPLCRKQLITRTHLKQNFKIEGETSISKPKNPRDRLVFQSLYHLLRHLQDSIRFQKLQQAGGLQRSPISKEMDQGLQIGYTMNRWLKQTNLALVLWIPWSTQNGGVKTRL